MKLEKLHGCLQTNPQMNIPSQWLSAIFLGSLLREWLTNQGASVFFDESLNKVDQTEEMDFLVRFWDESTGEVCLRYLGSEFIGHTTSSDLKNFQEAVSSLNANNMLQVSVDGPNMNHKFLRELNAARQAENKRDLLDLWFAYSAWSTSDC